MRGHLSDHDLMESFDHDPPSDVCDHLAGCAACRAERERLQAAVIGLADQAHTRAGRSEAEWDRQTRQILARVHRSVRPGPRWLWAYVPALVGVAALAGVWFRSHSPRVAAPVEPDEALLAAVQQSVQAEVPSALRPLALLLDAVEDDETSNGRSGRQGG